MRAAPLFLALLFVDASHAAQDEKEAKPLRFDWNDFGVRGDKDFTDKLEAAKKKYDGKKVIVTGILAMQSSGGREAAFYVLGPSQTRGEAQFNYSVHASMMDPPLKMLEQANRKSLIEVVGTMEAKQLFFKLRVDKITGLRPFKK